MSTLRWKLGLLMCSLALLAWAADTAHAQNRKGKAGTKAKDGGKDKDKEADESNEDGGVGTSSLDDSGGAKKKKSNRPMGAGTAGGSPAAGGVDDGGSPKRKGGVQGIGPAGGSPSGGMPGPGGVDDGGSKKRKGGVQGLAPSGGRKGEEDGSDSGKEGMRRGSEDDDGTPDPGDRIAWRDTLQNAIKDATSGGKPILVDFYAEWCGPCKQLDATTFKDPGLIGYVNKNFVAVKVDVDKHTSVAKEYSVQAMPTTAVLRPDGKEVGRFVGYRDAPSYESELKKLMDKVGDLAAASAKAKKLLDEANANLAGGKYAVAIGQLRQIIEKHKDTAEGKAAAEKLKDVEDIADGKLKTLKDAAKSGNFVEMSKMVAELQDVFAGTNAAREAKEIQNSLANNKEAQKQIRVALVKQALEQTQADIKADRYANAFDRLKNIIRDYPDEPRYVEEAKWQLELLNKNPMAVRKARDEVAAGQSKIWLSLARTWKSNRNSSRAKEYYQKVIDTFPGTSFAEQAEREMTRGG